MYKFWDQLVAYLRGMGHAVSTPSDIQNLKIAIANKMNEPYPAGSGKRVDPYEIDVEHLDNYLSGQVEKGRISQEFADDMSVYLDDVLEARSAEKKIADEMYDQRGRTVIVNDLEEAIPDPVFRKNLVDKFGEAEVLEAARIKANSTGVGKAAGLPTSTADDELVWLLEGRNHPEHPLYYDRQVGASDIYKQASIPTGENITDIATARTKLNMEDLNKLDEDLRKSYIDDDAASTMTLDEYAIQERGYGYPASAKHPGITSPFKGDEFDDIFSKMQDDPINKAIMDAAKPTGTTTNVGVTNFDTMKFGLTKQLDEMSPEDIIGLVNDIQTGKRYGIANTQQRNQLVDIIRQHPKYQTSGSATKVTEGQMKTQDELMDEVKQAVTTETDKLKLGSKQYRGATAQIEEMTQRALELEKAGDFEGAQQIIESIEDYRGKVQNLKAGDPDFPILIDPTRKPHATGGRIGFANGLEVVNQQDDLEGTFSPREYEKKAYGDLTREDSLELYKRALSEMGLNSPEAYQEAVRIGAIPVEMYSIEQLFPGYDPAYAQGGRVGLQGGGGFFENLNMTDEQTTAVDQFAGQAFDVGASLGGQRAAHQINTSQPTLGAAMQNIQQGQQDIHRHIGQLQNPQQGYQGGMNMNPYAQQGALGQFMQQPTENNGEDYGSITSRLPIPMVLARPPSGWQGPLRQAPNTQNSGIVPAYAQGGRVGFYGGGYSDLLMGEDDSEDYMQVADVSQTDIDAVRNTLKVRGMNKASPGDIKDFTKQSGINVDHLSHAEVEGIMDGTIDEPTGRYEILTADEPWYKFW